MGTWGASLGVGPGYMARPPELCSSSGQLKSVGAVEKSGLISGLQSVEKNPAEIRTKVRARRLRSWCMYVHALSACGSL